MRHFVLRIVSAAGFGRVEIFTIRTKFRGRSKQSILARITFCGRRINAVLYVLHLVYISSFSDSTRRKTRWFKYSWMVSLYKRPKNSKCIAIIKSVTKPFFILGDQSSKQKRQFKTQQNTRLATWLASPTLISSHCRLERDSPLFTLATATEKDSFLLENCEQTNNGSKVLN